MDYRARHALYAGTIKHNPPPPSRNIFRKMRLFLDQCSTAETPIDQDNDSYGSIRYLATTFTLLNLTASRTFIPFYVPAAGDPISVSRVEWLVVECSVL